MEITFVKYLTGDESFVGAILEFKGNIQYITNRTFIELISLKKHLNITTSVLKDTLVSGSIQCLMQKMIFGGSR